MHTQQSPHSRYFMNNATNSIAVAAAASPVWLPWLQTASEISAIVAPILGVMWLVVQIWTKLRETFQKDK